MSRWLRRLPLVFLAGALAASAASAGELADKLVAAAGPDVLAVVRVDNLDATLKKADRFGEVYSAQISAMFPLIAPGIIGQIDLTQPIALVLVNPKKYPAATPVAGGVVCTARAAAGLIAGLGTAGTAADGITPITTAGGKQSYAASLGQEVLVSDSRELVVAAMAATAAAEPPPSVKGDIRVHVPAAGVLKLYGQDLVAARQAMLAAMSMAQTNNGMSAEGLKAVIGMEFDWMEALGRQTQDVGFGVELDGGDLVIHQRLQPIAGSALEAFLKSQLPPAASLLGGLPEDGVMRFGFSLRPSPQLLDAYMSMLDAFRTMQPAEAGATPVPLPDAAELRPKLEAFLKNMGPRIAGAVLAPAAGKTGLRFVETVEYADPDGFGPLMDQMMKTWGPGLKDLYRKMGIESDIRVGPATDPGLPAGSVRDGVLVHESARGAERGVHAALRRSRVPDRVCAGDEERRGGVRSGQHRPGEGVGRPSERAARSRSAGSAGSARRAGRGVHSGSAGYMNMIFALMPPEQGDKARESMAGFLKVKLQMVMAASIEGSVVHAQTRYPLLATLQAVKASADEAKRGGAPHPAP